MPLCLARLGDVKYKQYRTMKTQMRSSAGAGHAGLPRADEPRKALALRTMAFAEEILCKEQDADPNVVIAAALLGDLTCPRMPPANGTAPTADAGAAEPVRTILEKLEYPNGFVKAVRSILAARSRRPGKTISISASCMRPVRWRPHRPRDNRHSPNAGGFRLILCVWRPFYFPSSGLLRFGRANCAVPCHPSHPRP